MAQNILYHEVAPQNNNPEGFVEFNTIDWELMVEGRSLLKNSIVIEADIQVFSAGATDLVVADRIGLENKIGFHGIFESWSCEGAGQNLQNLTDYPRYVNMVASSTLGQNDINDIKYQAEGRSPTEAGGRYVLQQNMANHNGSTSADRYNLNDFSVMPKICFNSMVGDDYSFNTNGSIRVSCNLARNNQFLHGSGTQPTSSYKIFNPVLRFISVPDSGKQGKMIMNSAVSVKTTVNSQQANIGVKVPAQACNGVVISFIKQSNDNAVGENSYALEQYPELDEVQYLFSDATNKYITYVIDDHEEMRQRGLNALTDSRHNQVNASTLKANNGDIIGLSFEEFIDLRNQKFTVQLKSSAIDLATNPRLVFLYFLNLISL